MAPKTERQVSAGGVAARRRDGAVEVALIAVGSPPRWQLPKGMVEQGETPEQAALREVREEAGIDTELLASLDTIEYWYQVLRDGQRVRIHKFVHFFLMVYRSGDVANHDDEVHEARWFAMTEALSALAFANERKVVLRASELLDAGSDPR